MIDTLINTLSDHLNFGDNHVVKVSSNGLKLVKNEKKQRFAFSLKDIIEKYQSIENFITALPQKGFKKDVVFTLQRIYTKNDKTTYHTVQQITHDLTQIMAQTSQIQTPPLNFLSSPQIMQKMIEAERANDYKGTIDTLKETIKDLKSENRSLHEEKRALQIQVETSKQREELNLEKSKLDQKSFFESPAFEKTIDALGVILPKFLTNNNNTGLGAAALHTNLSATKRAFIKKISTEDVSEEQLLFFNYLIDNWNEQLITKVAQLIEQNEEEHES